VSNRVIGMFYARVKGSCGRLDDCSMPLDGLSTLIGDH